MSVLAISTAFQQFESTWPYFSDLKMKSNEWSLTIGMPDENTSTATFNYDFKKMKYSRQMFVIINDTNISDLIKEIESNGCKNVSFLKRTYCQVFEDISEIITVSAVQIEITEEYDMPVNSNIRSDQIVTGMNTIISATNSILQRCHILINSRNEFEEYVNKAKKTAIDKYNKKQAEIRAEKERIARVKLYKSKGVCQYCGGSFKGLFKKKCSVCLREKDY